jgi:hypothetical protein
VDLSMLYTVVKHIEQSMWGACKYRQSKHWSTQLNFSVIQMWRTKFMIIYMPSFIVLRQSRMPWCIWYSRVMSKK